jgi:hypothetical protein
MLQRNRVVGAKNQDEAELRTMRHTLIARYDSGAMPPVVFVVIRQLETELSWREHRRGRP